MSNLLIAFFFAAGASGWVYAKMSRRTGGNMQPVLVVTAVTFLFVLFIAWSILDTFLS